MKDQIIREIEHSMLPHLNNAQMQQLRMALEHAFYNKCVSDLDPAEAAADDSNDLVLLNMFLAAKKVEGCSEKTIRYYGNTLTKMLNALDVKIAHITTDDLRNYLALLLKICDTLSVSTNTILKEKCVKNNIQNIADQLERLTPSQLEIAEDMLNKLIKAFALEG